MAPSQLTIATSSLQRLIKEEASYHKELSQQEARLKKLESETGDENREYMIKQEKTGIQETQRLFPEMKNKIRSGVERLEDILKVSSAEGDEVSKAKQAVEAARESLAETS